MAANEALYLNKTTFHEEETTGNAIAITHDGTAGAVTLDIITGVGNGDIPIKLIVVAIAQLKAATLTCYLTKNGVKYPLITFTAVGVANILNTDYRSFCNADGVGNYYLPITDADVIQLVVTSVDASHNAVIHWAGLTKEA